MKYLISNLECWIKEYYVYWYIYKITPPFHDRHIG
jgi:hypothetical protein